MEGDDVNTNSNSSNNTTLSSNSRWNPTKEQINMLESLYAQGIRTPSAEQIQQMTATLRAFGHIEGKNVFYWFQNHKARQRQKQKQERIAFINRYLHNKTAASVFPTSTNVVRGPYYIARNDLGFYPQSNTKLLIPATGGSKRRAAASYDVAIGPSCRGYDPEQQEYNIMVHSSNIKNVNDGFITTNWNKADDVMISCNNQETLPLFPLHPTGILQAKTPSTAPASLLPWDVSLSTLSDSMEKCTGDQPFFDFFSGQEGTDK